MTASASDAHPFPIYNARFRFIAPLFDADGDLVTGASTPDSEVSQDCGTFADATNEMTEIASGSGMYYLDLVAGEMDTKSTAIIMKSATSGMKTTPVVLYPKRFPVVRTGTAQAGGASSITLDASASAIDGYYVGCYVNITNNTPTNAQGQARMITAYVGSTKVCTVEGTYGTNPSSSSTFEVLATELWLYANANVTHVGGTAQTGRDLGASVLLSPGTGTGQISLSSGAVLLQATQTGVTIPTVTNLTNAPTSGDFTSTMKTSIGTAVAASAVASVTGNVGGNVAGSVGSVTGNVGGNVTGSVGSVASGGITASSLASDCITAAKVAADVTTEIQSGLATASALSTVDTEVAAIKAKTDNLPASPAATSDIPTAAQNADKLLGRSLAGSADGGRTVRDALRPLRNKTSIAGGTMTVCEEDDATPAWTAAVTTTAGDPLSEIDPA